MPALLRTKTKSAILNGGLVLFFCLLNLTLIFSYNSLVYADCTFVRGKVNPDAEIDIADPIFILHYLFQGSAAPVVLDAADVNDDGAIDIGDVIYLLAYLFAGGPAPLPPFPGPGIDPTEDSLGCTQDLLPCPEGLIGPAGGEVSSSDNKVKVIFPAETLGECTQLKFNNVNLQELAESISGSCFC